MLELGMMSTTAPSAVVVVVGNGSLARGVWLVRKTVEDVVEVAVVGRRLGRMEKELWRGGLLTFWWGGYKRLECESLKLTVCWQR